MYLEWRKVPELGKSQSCDLEVSQKDLSMVLIFLNHMTFHILHTLPNSCNLLCQIKTST